MIARSRQRCRTRGVKRITLRSAGRPRLSRPPPNLKSPLNKTPNFKQQKKRREDLQKKRNEEKQRQQAARKYTDPLPPKH